MIWNAFKDGSGLQLLSLYAAESDDQIYIHFTKRNIGPIVGIFSSPRFMLQSDSDSISSTGRGILPEPKGVALGH